MMMTMILSKTSAAMVSVAAACALLSSVAAHAASTEASGDQARAVEHLVQAEMAVRGIPGAQVAIVQQQKIVFTGAFGLATLDGAIPVTPHTVFPINSISKAVAGVAVMQLVEAGQLDLDAPLITYLASLPSAWGAVTVRHALTHMSGLPEIVDDNVRAIDGAEPEVAWQKVQSLPLDAQPGTRFDYTQTNYVVIGKLIETLTKRAYADFIRERQFMAAGLTQTRFSIDGEPDAASLYSFLTLQVQGMKTVGVERTKVPLLRHEPMTAYLDAAGGVKTTATDLAKWVIALQSAKLVSASSLDQLWKPQAQKDGTFRGFNALVNGYGLGWPSARRDAHPALTPVGGARAAVFIYPRDDLTVLMLTNLLGASPEKFIDKIASIYIPDLVPAGR